jgi:hypothetical protein
MAVETYGLPQEEDQQQALVDSSAPMATQPTNMTGLQQQQPPPISGSSGGALAGQPPVPAQAPGGPDPAQTPAPAQGGPDLTKDRGTPDKMLRTQWRDNAESLAEMQENIANKMEKAANNRVSKAQAQELTESMKAQGADPSKAVADNLKMAEEEIDHTVKIGEKNKKWGNKIKKRLRNVYKRIPEDEMGLFLMEFGMRAMMAGETMGTMGALGAAGSGAMSSLQGRQQAEEDRALAADKYANEQGLAEFGALTDRQTADAATMTAEARRDAYGADRSYQGEKVYLEDIFRKAGWNDKQIADHFSGKTSPSERRQILNDTLQKVAAARPYDEDQITGKEFGAMKSADIEAWIDEMMKIEGTTERAKSGQDYINAANGG